MMSDDRDLYRGHERFNARFAELQRHLFVCGFSGEQCAHALSLVIATHRAWDAAQTINDQDAAERAADLAEMIERRGASQGVPRLTEARLETNVAKEMLLWPGCRASTRLLDTEASLRSEDQDPIYAQGFKDGRAAERRDLIAMVRREVAEQRRIGAALCDPEKLIGLFEKVPALETAVVTAVLASLMAEGGMTLDDLRE